jgi:hypothetical protein
MPDLRVGGTIDSPALSGRVDVMDDGRITIGGRTYHLRDSQVRFAVSHLAGPPRSCRRIGELRFPISKRLGGAASSMPETRLPRLPMGRSAAWRLPPARGCASARRSRRCDLMSRTVQRAVRTARPARALLNRSDLLTSQFAGAHFERIRPRGRRGLREPENPRTREPFRSTSLSRRADRAASARP